MADGVAGIQFKRAFKVLNRLEVISGLQQRLPEIVVPPHAARFKLDGSSQYFRGLGRSLNGQQRAAETALIRRIGRPQFGQCPEIHNRRLDPAARQLNVGEQCQRIGRVFGAREQVFTGDFGFVQLSAPK